MDSFEGRADPITQLAIDDMHKCGLRESVTKFVEEIERSGYLDANMARHKLKDAISREFQDLGFPDSKESFQGGSRIRDFRRVVLCHPRWPSFRQRRIDLRAAHICLDEIIGNLKSFVKYLQTDGDLPIEVVAKAIGSNISGGRTAARIGKVVQEICLQYDSRAQ
jgi:hypothetical protein